MRWPTVRRARKMTVSDFYMDTVNYIKIIAFRRVFAYIS